MGQGRLGDGVDRTHVEIEHLVVKLVVEILVAEAPDQAAGIVDEDVDAAERRSGVIDDLGGTVRSGHVTGHQGGKALLVLDAFDDLLRRHNVAVAVHGNAGAERAEGPRQLRPDADRRAGDEDVLAFEIVEHDRVPCVSGLGPS